MSKVITLRDKLRYYTGRLPFAPFFIQLRKKLTSYKHYTDIQADVKNMSHTFGEIRKNYPALNGKKVLFLSFTDAIYQLKLECMLATTLRSNGWNPYYLSSRLLTYARDYYKAYGIYNPIFWEDISAKHVRESEIKKSADDLISKGLTFSKVKEWRYRHAWIGPQILSLAARIEMAGTPDPTKPNIAAAIKRILPQVLRFVHCAEALLEELKPDLVCTVEPNYAVNGAIIDTAIAKGIDVIHFCQPVRDDALLLKRLNPETRRTHPNSIDNIVFEKFLVQGWSNDKEQQLNEEMSMRYSDKWKLASRNQRSVTGGKTKEQLFKYLSIDDKKPTAVVFSHILWDANLFYGEDIFEDYGDWFIQTVKAACANTNVNWLIKLHPANAWKREQVGRTGELAEETLIHEHIGVLPHHVKLIYPTDDVSTLQLFQVADIGITVRGTTGMEMPIFGKPFLTAGTGRYSGFGFTDDSKTKEEYLQKLSSIHKHPPQSEEQLIKAKIYAYVAFRKRPWLMTSYKAEFRSAAANAHPLDHNLYPQVRSIKDILKAPDLNALVNWINDKNQIDYLSDI